MTRLALAAELEAEAAGLAARGVHEIVAACTMREQPRERGGEGGSGVFVEVKR